MRFSVISLFPEMFDAVENYGVVGRAIKRKMVELVRFNPRDFTKDKHRSVDDRPYGGGPGMLMMIEPLEKAIQSAKNETAETGVDSQQRTNSNNKESAMVIYLSPQGQKLDQALARELSLKPHLILVAGRYEGVDQRLIDKAIDLEVSIGDFVLSGGELAAMTLIDTITRLKPEVLGHQESAIEDSFEDGLLDHPHYTRPESYQGQDVPSVLLSGDHQAIAQWRLQQRLGRTWLKRPDLLAKKELSDHENGLLDEFKNEFDDQDPERNH